jgi:hydrogenase maturation factor HypF (carbamoyltransferase family)
VQYCSTRGSAPILAFDDVLLAGLARDGGLYLPETWPILSMADAGSMRQLSYPALAARVLAPFAQPAIDEAELLTIANEVYGTSPNLGAFLPYAPLQALLLQTLGPLVMTSANLTGLPIIIDDSEALRFPAEHTQCAGVLYHNRAIVRRVDDSVAMVVRGKPVLLRRARGYVPLPIPFAGEDGHAVLALGAQQKSTICDRNRVQ